MDSSLANWDGSMSPQRTSSTASSSSGASASSKKNTANSVASARREDSGDANPGQTGGMVLKNGGGSGDGQTQNGYPDNGQATQGLPVYFGPPRQLLTKPLVPAILTNESSLGAALGLSPTSITSNTALSANAASTSASFGSHSSLLRAPSMPLPTGPSANAQALPTFGPPDPTLLPPHPNTRTHPNAPNDDDNFGAGSSSSTLGLSMTLSGGMDTGAMGRGGMGGGMGMGLSLSRRGRAAPSALNSPTALRNVGRAPSPPPTPENVRAQKERERESERVKERRREWEESGDGVKDGHGGGGRARGRKSASTSTTKAAVGKAKSKSKPSKANTASQSQRSSSPLSSLSPSPPTTTARTTSTSAGPRAGSATAAAGGSWWTGVYPEQPPASTALSSTSSSTSSASRARARRGPPGIRANPSAVPPSAASSSTSAASRARRGPPGIRVNPSAGADVQGSNRREKPKPREREQDKDSDTDTDEDEDKDREREKDKEKNKNKVQAVRYESRMVREKEKAARSDNAKSVAADASAGSDNSTDRDALPYQPQQEEQLLFMPSSPDLDLALGPKNQLDLLNFYASESEDDVQSERGEAEAEGPGVYELFTPPPMLQMEMDVGDLFTPPPHEPEQQSEEEGERERERERRKKRPPPAPGVGVARKVVRGDDTQDTHTHKKRKREEMAWVLVPRAPYPLKRARVETTREVGRSKSGSVIRTYAGRGRSTASASASRWGRDGEDESGSESDDGKRSVARASTSRAAKSKSKSRSYTTGRRIKMESEEEEDDDDDAEAAAAQDGAPSLGAVFNQAFAQNERGGTIPVGKAVREAATVVGVKRKAARRAPSKHTENQSEETDNGQERRIRRAPRPRDEELLVSAPPQKEKQKQRRPSGWCDEPTAEGVVRLHWDLEVEEADRAAYAGMLLHLGVEAGAGAEHAFAGAGVRVRGCLVWPLGDGKGAGGEMSAGGPVRGMWPAAEEGKARRRQQQRDEGQKVTGGKKMVEVAPATTQRSPSPTHKEMRPQFSPLQMQLQEGPSTVYRSKPRPHALLPQPSKSYPTLPSSAMSPATPSYPAFPSPSHSAPPSSIPNLSPSFSSPFTSNAMNTIAAQGLGQDEQMPLSVKAWGKQKARSPSPGDPHTWIHSSGSRGGHSRRTSASHGPRDPMHSPVEDFSAFINPPDSSPPRMDPSNQHVTPQGLHYYPITPATSNPVPATSMEEPEPEPHPPDFYSLPFDTEPYGNGTIDPSLLGGEPEVDMAYEPQVEAHEGEHEMDDSFERQEQEEDVRMRSPSPPEYSSSEEEGAPLALRSSRSRPIHPHIPADMIPTGTVHSDGRSPSSDYVPPAPASPQQKPKSSPNPSRPKQTAVKRRVEKGGKTKVDASAVLSVHNADPFFRYSGPPWPQGDPDVYCHQCRRKTGHLLVKYEGCRHAFCVRCVMFKYEPNTIAFEANPDDDDCPRCNQTCTCDHCSTRRGESYKFGRQLSKPEESLGLRVRRTLGEARPKQNPYHVLEQQVIEPTTYYATMYDETGTRIGRTFLGADGDNTIVVAQPARGPRVFIGAVAKEWGLGPNPVVHSELTPIRGKRFRGRGSGRFCVGDERVLRLRVRQRAPDPLPLSEPAADLVPTVADPVPAVEIPDVIEPSIPAPSSSASVHVDATAPLAAPPSPSPPPVPVAADVEMNSPSDMELDSEMGGDVLNDAFSLSPLSSVTNSDEEDNGAAEGESETAGEDDGRGHGKEVSPDQGDGGSL